MTEASRAIVSGIRLSSAALAAALAFAVASPAPAAEQGAPPVLPAELAAVRAALLKYQDPLLAVRDGYFSTLGCVEYANGAMGVHFLNARLIGPTPDPARPAVLLYEPDGDGRLRLVAAEWFVPVAAGAAERPTLHGQPFDGPMEGHEPLMPNELHHYDLHAWLFKSNPAGLFNAVNPDVRCAGQAGYALMEEPPRLVPVRQ